MNRMLYADTKTSLPDDLLLKADKMTMANSLELRVPFLDHKLLEFAASLAHEFQGKAIDHKIHCQAGLWRVCFPARFSNARRSVSRFRTIRGCEGKCEIWVQGHPARREAIERGYFKKSPRGAADFRSCLSRGLCQGAPVSHNA